MNWHGYPDDAKKQTTKPIYGQTNKKSENLQELYGHERGYMKQKRVFGDFWTREGHMWLTHAE